MPCSGYVIAGLCVKNQQFPIVPELQKQGFNGYFGMIGYSDSEIRYCNRVH